MTDSSEDQEKLEYLKKDLFRPISWPWKQRYRPSASTSQNNDGGGEDQKLAATPTSPSDDSNHLLYMSEPSVSEADSTSADQEHHSLRLLSPGADMESLTDEQSVDDIDGLPPPPPPGGTRLLGATPQQQNLTTQSPASPGGNTSLSSWESPHMNRRIHLHFSPDPSPRRAESSSDPREDNNNKRINNSNPSHRGFVHPSSQYPSSSQQHQYQHHHGTSNNRGGPPGGRGGEFAGGAADNQPSSATSGEEVSSDQRQQAVQFLNDLRASSEGQVGESSEGAADYSFDSSYQVPDHHQRMQQVLRTTTTTTSDRQRQQTATMEERQIPINETELGQNAGDLSALSPILQDGEANAKTDDTIVMVLSDSGDEREITDGAGSYNHRALDWEQRRNSDDEPGKKNDDYDQHHSADDEKTTEEPKPSRSRTHNGKLPASHRKPRSLGERKQFSGHRRQRSGDEAAATLSTGSAIWKGLVQDNIPLPSPCEDDDDDDEYYDEDSARIELREQGRNNVNLVTTKSTVENTVHGFRIPSNRAVDIAQFSRFALGDDAPPASVAGASARRPTSNRRYRRDVRPRNKKLWLELDSEDSSVRSNEHLISPNFASFQQNSTSTRHARVASHPIPSGIGVNPNSWAGAASPNSYDSQQYGHHSMPPYGIHPTSAFLAGGQFSYEDACSNYSPRWDNGGWQRKGSFDYAVGASARHPSRFSNFQSERPTSRATGNEQALGVSPSSTFSWLSAKNKVGSFNQKAGEVDPESQSLIDNQRPRVETIKNDDRDSAHGFSPESGSDGSSTDPEAVDHFKAHMNHYDTGGPSMRVVRHADNNLFQDQPATKQGRFDRRRFSVMTTSMPEDEKKFPTYTCPNCKTRQREFFTVSSAPKTFESASGYIAFYFSIYVIAALYLFGLQEGWGNLDCIYFAVITLTTAGLGDFVPTTDGAKIICSVFIYFGVACIGLLLGSYIAGMLDESSSRTARENRIKSCPNCSRIRNIKIAAERRHTSHSMRRGSFHSPQNDAYFSIRPSTILESDEYEPDSKKIKRQHQESPVMSSFTESVRADKTNLAAPQSSVQAHASPHSVTHKEAVQPNTILSPILPGYSSISPRFSPGPPNNMLGSPMTTQILRRQSHSRHASIDIGGTNHLASAFKSQPNPRTRQLLNENLPKMATFRSQPNTRRQPLLNENLPRMIPETMSQDREPTPPPPPIDGWPTENTFDDTYDSESSSSESDRSDLEDEELKNDGMKNAKYVFMTLKEALLNSVVIITFGCMGFCFIEGFSVIDSWYFTTVLLTTVGYGDLCPYTKGGKLFATIYILVAGTILLNNMSMISMIPLELRKRRTERAVLEQFGDSLDDAALRELATGPLVQRLNLSYQQNPTGLDECTREMFSLAMLVRLGKVTEEDIKQTFAAFRKLDIHDEGVLNSRSIIAGMIQKHRNSTVHLRRLASNETQSTAGIPFTSPTTHGFPAHTGTPFGGYGSTWSGGAYNVGVSYPYGPLQAVQMPVMSERSALQPAGPSYGAGMPENSNDVRRARTGSA